MPFDCIQSFYVVLKRSMLITKECKAETYIVGLVRSNLVASYAMRYRYLNKFAIGALAPPPHPPPPCKITVLLFILVIVRD